MIGRNIQSLRKQAGLTQEALAGKIGVARQTVVKWESGESSPDLEAAGRLAGALGVTIDDLVGMPPEEIIGDKSMKGKHLFGLVTVGDKGQIVIPARARKIFHIQPGTQLMVLGDESTGLALVDGGFFLAAMEEMRHGK